MKTNGKLHNCATNYHQPMTSMDYYFANPHPNSNYDHSTKLTPSSSDFLLSDYLILDDCIDHQESTESSEKVTFSDLSHGFNGATSRNNNLQVYFSSLLVNFSHVH